MIYWKQSILLIESDTVKQEIFITFIESIIDLSYKLRYSELDTRNTITQLLQIYARGLVRYDDYRNLLEFAPYLASNGVHRTMKEHFLLFDGISVQYFILRMKLAIEDLR